jgi:hypothetical protein
MTYRVSSFDGLHRYMNYFSALILGIQSDRILIKITYAFLVILKRTEIRS